MDTHNALTSVFIPILANILNSPEEERFRTIREQNTTISKAIAAIGNTSAHRLLADAGFVRTSQLNTTTKEEEFIWTLPISPSDRVQQLNAVRNVLQQLRAAPQLYLDAAGSAVEPEKKNSFNGVEDEGKNVDLNQIRRLKELKAQRLLAEQRQQQSSSTVGASATVPSTTTSTGVNSGLEDESTDFTSVQHLIDKVKLTIHKTGRLRNYSFEARDFTLRRMYNGRMAHLCGEERCLQKGKWAPSAQSEQYRGAVDEVTSPVPATGGKDDGERGHCLEAHWHVRNANMIYSYVAHLNPSGTKVLHMGEEFGYQYNSLPGTDHFGKTVLLSIKKVNMDTHMLESIRSTNKPADKCIVCGTPFAKLWL